LKAEFVTNCPAQLTCSDELSQLFNSMLSLIANTNVIAKASLSAQK